MKRRTSPRKPGKKIPAERDPEPGPSTGRRVTTRGRGRPVKREAVAVPPPSPRKSCLTKRPLILGSPTQTKITKTLPAPANKTSSVLDVGASSLRHSNSSSSLQSSLPQPQVIDLSMPAPTPGTSKCIESNRNKLTTAAFSHSRECDNDLPMKKMKLMLDRMSTTKTTDCDTDDSPFLFNCPPLGLELLKEVEMYREIFKYLLYQPDDETGKVQSLMIRSCNRDGNKVQDCVDILCKCLDNLIKYPENPKFKSIRYESKTFKEKVADVRGASEFLCVAGFVKIEDKGAYIFFDDAELSAERFKLMKDKLLSTEALEIRVNRNMKVFRSSSVPTNTAQDQSRSSAPKPQSVKYTNIRICFPDGTTLQGTFSASETIGDVYRFVRDNLVERPGFLRKFVLKKALSGEYLTVMTSSLNAARLTPSSLLNFEPISPPPSPGQEISYLKSELLAQLG